MWKQLRGEARQRWGELSDDEVDQIDGDIEKLVGKLQEKYGYTREKAQKEADDFLTKMESKYRF
jgi:uncharacterized protein YjbJ (UPF0337 family)